MKLKKKTTTKKKRERERRWIQFHINLIMQVQERGSFYLASGVCNLRLLLGANITIGEKGAL